MNITLAILLVLALLPPRVCRPLNIVFVTPPGEEFTTEEQQQALTSIRAAASWWHDLSPIVTDIMGDTATAYHMRFVGCQSLAAMGRPCEKVYLPGMASAPAM